MYNKCHSDISQLQEACQRRSSVNQDSSLRTTPTTTHLRKNCVTPRPWTAQGLRWAGYGLLPSVHLHGATPHLLKINLGFPVITQGLSPYTRSESKDNKAPLATLSRLSLYHFREGEEGD
ncbi:tetratricopeptide repeat protein 39C [Lates japonicus]|uniref:Tetratricopeptide repeat protein 39C n=1 Tax=Lates japonicus TaxID=270547 RepID=A0AAD3RCM4_LATJO|nr:tetratricopeptide repeat protein 39C [Lates japonicus]